MKIDRRIIYLIIFLAVLLPLFFYFPLKIPISPDVRNAYMVYNNLKPGSKVIVSFDYDPSTEPELHPMAKAILRHFFRNDIKVIAMALWPQGAAMAQNALSSVLEDEEIKNKNLVYGEDYVNLGYVPGNIAVLWRMGTDILEVFPKDNLGNITKDLPIMEGVKNYRNIDAIFGLSAGDPGLPAWVIVAVDRFGAKNLGGGCTAVSAPQFSPYVNTGQLIGLLGGLKGAAEYESLMNYIGDATKRMGSQSIAHVVIIIFIIIGNIAYLATRRAQKKYK